MNEETKKEIRLKIKALIEKSAADIIDIEKMTQPVTPENAIGRVSRMDAINNKSVMEAALRNKKRKLSKLKMALSNIDNDNWGICKNCKRSIQEKRLIFLPESTLCVNCASRA